MKQQAPFLPLRLILLLLGTLLTEAAFSQTVSNDFQTRTEIKFSVEPLDKLTLNLNPEVRWDESFGVSKYMLQGGLSYKPFKGLTLGGAYRFVINPRESKATEYLRRFALYTSYKKKIERFEPSLRIKYTNYTEDISLGEFLRYRAKLEYDIKSCKITPLISAEAFHNLSGNQIYKMRYALGAEYKLNKKSSLGLGYMLDYYMQDYRNKHIISLGYKYKF